MLFLPFYLKHFLTLTSATTLTVAISFLYSERDNIYFSENKAYFALNELAFYYISSSKIK